MYLYYVSIAVVVVILIYIFFYVQTDNFSNKSNKCYVEYYSLSRCPHCVDFNPLWEKFSNSCSNTKKYVVDKDGDTAKDRIERFNINSFPTIIVTQDDQKIDEMKDGRTCKSLTALCSKHQIQCGMKC